MNNLKKLIYNLALMLIIIFSTYSKGFTQPPPCDTCNYTYDIEKDPDRTKGLIPYNPKGTSTVFALCDSSNNDTKNITFIHGLGGNASSWDYQVTWTDSSYITATVNTNYSGTGWEHSYHNVGINLNGDIYSRVAAGASWNRCPNDDYVIAHSQGGIAARYLDRQWDIALDSQGTFGFRKFYGLVTFGTPHAGADIALSQDDHFGFVQKAVSTVLLNDLGKSVYDLTNRFGFLIGTKAYDLLDGLDSLVKNSLAPMMLSSLHTNTLNEMKPNSLNMTQLNSHTSRLHKVTFYGIEEEPECWRVMDNIANTSAEEYPLFGAEPDDGFKDTMELIRATHRLAIDDLNFEIKILEHKGFWSKVYKGKLKRWRKERDHRQKAVNFMHNANTEWRYLIGAYHLDSFTYSMDTTYTILAQYKVNGVVLQSMEFHYSEHSKMVKDLVTLTGNGWLTSHWSTVSQVRNRSYFPSDAVVLAKSAVAYPDVPKDARSEMPENNHFQLRNSPEAKRVLQNLYNGKYGNYFKILER